MSQTNFGKALGVTYQQVQKYENGTDRNAVCRLMAIARMLEFPLPAFNPSAEGDEGALLTHEEIAALAASRQIGSPVMRGAAVDALKTFAALAPSERSPGPTKRARRS
ncbi:helix-turn-helix domain-containing protein [Salinarimonas sp.]|uniref:helix-turn-helix domain-containing protein n=1 Tax=Salinarimonas sp. TaxID=2766526 RepID=UPI00391B0D08